MVRKFLVETKQGGQPLRPTMPSKERERERSLGLRQFYNFNLALLTKLA